MRRRLVVALAVVVTIGAGVAFALYPGQTASRLTHLGGSATKTEAIPPFPAGAGPVLRLEAVGDPGYSGDRVMATGRAVATLAETRPYDALLVLGDNVYPDGDPAELDDTVFRPFDVVLDRGARLIPILGNHDVAGGHAAGQVEALGMPGRWYAVDLGEVLVVALDSNEVGDPAQRTWLDTTLRAATEPWRIALVHHPPYSAGYQGSSIETRHAFAPLFEQYGVQLVLSGHEHDYERSRPIRGVTYLVTGAASNTRRTGTRDFTAFATSWHSFADIAVFPDHIVVRGVNQDARMFDEVTIALEA